MSRLVAAQKLDNDVGVRIGDEVGRSVGQEIRRQASIARGVDVADGDPDQLEPPTPVGSKSIRVFDEGADDLAAHCPGPQEGNPERGSGHRGVTARLVDMAPRW
jgi:hypothetical protein